VTPRFDGNGDGAEAGKVDTFRLSFFLHICAVLNPEQAFNRTNEVDQVKKVVAIAVLLVATLALCGYFYFKQPPKPQFKTLKVERGSIVSTVSATGTLNAVVTVQVGTQVSGTISKLYVDFNSPVKKGEAIARIDPALFESAVQQSTGNSLNAGANLAKAKVTLADAKRTLNRNKQLLQEGIIAQSDLDVAQTAYDSAVTGVRAAEATVIQNRGALKQAQTNLNYSIIRSPVDGIVVSRNVDVGQTVAASFQTPTLFTIAQDLTKMQIETSVDESDISRLKVGQPATFTVDAYPDQQFTGEVIQIRNAPIVTQNVVTYVAVVGVSNKELKLKPGMTANVTVQTQKKDDVLKIPGAALRFKLKTGKEEKGGKGPKPAKAQAGRGPEGGKAGRAGGKDNAVQKVYLLKQGKPVALSVATGISDGGFVEVVGGALKENDEVIVEQISDDKNKRPGMGPMGPRF
jgi:HlyD family secretion protein